MPSICDSICGVNPLFIASVRPVAGTRPASTSVRKPVNRPVSALLGEAVCAVAGWSATAERAGTSTATNSTDKMARFLSTFTRTLLCALGCAVILNAETSFARAQATPPLPPDAAQTSPPETLQQIFNIAFRRWQTYPVPPYAIWTATWHVTETPMGYYTGSASNVEVHRYAVRLADGMENVSDPAPNGKLPPAMIAPEFLGPFAFTTRSSVHVPPRGNGVTMLPDVAGLKTIATVVAIAQPAYTIGNTAGTPPIEQIDGHEAYHLQLHPRSDPEKHNLRDLWIDVQTHDLWKAHFAGTYRPTPKAPVSPTEVTVYFRDVVGCWVVTRAVWTYQNPPILFEFDVQNDEIGLPARLPDWLFDEAAYRKHQLAGEPDYLGIVLDGLRRRH